MKKLIIVLASFFCILSASAQKIYFIYIQSEQDQPFFVRLDNKVQSSSASGYIILSKLLDSTYTFTIGFPKDKWKEQKFTVKVDRKDHGFLLKNFGEKGWGLFDLQTMGVIMSLAAADKEPASMATEKQEVSEFTELLVKATGDPSLRERPTAQPQPAENKIAVTPIKEAAVTEAPVIAVVTEMEKKPKEPIEEKPVEEKPAETKAEVVVAETAKETEQIKIEEPTVATKEEKKEDPIIKTEESKPVVNEEVKQLPEEYKASVVTRRSESSTTEGFGLVFIDKYANGENDTIRLLIPNPKPLVTPVQEQPKEEKKMLDIPVEVTQQPEKKKEESAPAIEVAVTEAKSLSPVKCAETAVEADFFKLRKLMVSTESDTEMINEATKYFKTKCFTTLQISNLSTLFLTDEGRYKFFDAAYPYAADPENFSTLQAGLKDEYYITRFKAMLRN